MVIQSSILTVVSHAIFHTILNVKNCSSCYIPFLTMFYVHSIPNHFNCTILKQCNCGLLLVIINPLLTCEAHWKKVDDYRTSWRPELCMMRVRNGDGSLISQWLFSSAYRVVIEWLVFGLRVRMHHRTHKSLKKYKKQTKQKDKSNTHKKQ